MVCRTRSQVWCHRQLRQSGTSEDRNVGVSLLIQFAVIPTHRIPLTTIYSAMPAETIREYDHYIENTPAAPRIADIDDVVQVVAFLCEEGSRWITGSTTCANGGAVMV